MSTVDPGGALVPLKQTFALAEHLSVAPATAAYDRIDLRDRAKSHAVMTSGWHSIESDEHGAYAWSRGRVALLDLQRVSVRDLTLRIVVEPPVDEGLPRQSLRVLWNHADLGSFELDEGIQVLDIEVPASLQRVGLNRFEIRPKYWLAPAGEGGTRSQNAVGFKFRELLLISALEPPPASAVIATATSASMDQHPGTVISFFAPLPDAARFVSSGHLHFQGETPTDWTGRIRVDAKNESGEQISLFQRELAALVDHPSFEIDADLSGLLGPVLELTLSFALNPPATSSVPGTRRFKVNHRFLRPRGNGTYHFGLSAPRFEGQELVVERLRDVTFRGWVASDREREVRVLVNGVGQPTEHQQRPDIAHKYGSLAYTSGFRFEIAEAALGSEVRVEVFVDDELQRSIELSEAQIPSVPHELALRLEWTDPRIEGFEQAPAPHLAERLHGSARRVFVMLFDALRADQTQVFGSETVSTPSMTAMAARGVSFVHMRSNSSWTRTSVASLMTGLLPRTHNVMSEANTLPESLPYLPEILAANGFATIAVIANSVVDPKFGMGRGFQQIHRLYDNENKRRIEELKRSPEARAGFVWDQFIGPFLDEAGNSPFLVYLHEIDPHAPYLPPPPFDTLYSFDYAGQNSSDLKGWGRMLRDGVLALDAQDVAFLKTQYMGDVSYLDHYLGQILERLEERDLLEGTLILLVSDHGEEFMEHGRMTHGKTLFEESTHVPFIMMLEGVFPEGGRPETDAQLSDISPTVLDLLGLDIPASMQGRSLVPYLGVPDEFRAKRTSVGAVGPTDMLVYQGWKLVRTTRRGFAQHVLFNLASDPEERLDRFPQEAVLGHCLMQMLDSRLAGGNRAARQEIELDELDDEIRMNLKVLGYIH